MTTGSGNSSRARSIGHLNTVLHAIESTRPADRTEFLKPLADVAERLRRRGIVILVSDLYDKPSRVMEGLRRSPIKGTMSSSSTWSIRSNLISILQAAHGWSTWRPAPRCTWFPNC